MLKLFLIIDCIMYGMYLITIFHTVVEQIKKQKRPKNNPLKEK